jgi:tRNA (mo5U34)-methyltransferase
MPTLEDMILAKKWFYHFTLPSGAITQIDIPEDVHRIHMTRLEMMFRALEPLVGDRSANTSCIDLACHQGFFAYHLARRYGRVLGIDYQAQHIADANLIKAVFGLKHLHFMQANIDELDVRSIEPADFVLMFGLLYHLENPIGILRKAKMLARRALLIETQTTGFDLSGRVESGHHLWQHDMHGFFAIVEGQPNHPTGGTTSIELFPSKEGLVWILNKIGFAKIEIVPPPADAYEQLLTGRRIVLAAQV